MIFLELCFSLDVDLNPLDIGRVIKMTGSLRFECLRRSFNISRCDPDEEAVIPADSHCFRHDNIHARLRKRIESCYEHTGPVRSLHKETCSFFEVHARRFPGISELVRILGDEIHFALAGLAYPVRRVRQVQSSLISGPARYQAMIPLCLQGLF